MKVDLAIVGGGSAGFAAAIAARNRGLSVAMVERSKLGGTCVNVGCIPSKTLLAAAEAYQSGRNPNFPGIPRIEGPANFEAISEAIARVVGEARAEKYEDLVTYYDWSLIRADAHFEPGPVLVAGEEHIEARHYLIATGASPKLPPIPGLDEVDYLTSTSAMALAQLPESILVVGGNYVGLELGQAFARLGSRVTIVEALERLAPFEEPELSAVMEAALRREGIEILVGSQVVAVRRSQHGVVVTTSQGEEITAQHVLFASGRQPETSRLCLEAVDVRVKPSGAVEVDEELRTANERIWAAGDVTGGHQFVYVAARQGAVVVENAFEGRHHRLSYSSMPRVTFTHPNLASVGLTDLEAQQRGIPCACRVIPASLLARAAASQEAIGVIKLVANAATRQVLGIHLAAPNAGEVILAASYAIQANLTVDQLAEGWAPYLTWAEGIRLAAQSFGADVSKLSCCAA